MSYQDAFDLLTPVVLVPFNWLLFKSAVSSGSSQTEEMAFMVFAAIWVLGQGLHLSANSANNLIETLAKRQEIDIMGTRIYQLIYFYDEHLSHYIWHIGILGLAGLLMFRECQHPSEASTIWWATIIAGLIYGFTYFSVFLEGETVPLGLPFAVAITLLGLIWNRKKLVQRPLIAFFFCACLVAVILFAGWGLYWGGFPQFTEVGLI